MSWNYPLHNMLGPMISAMFAGNACVVKVSEYTAWSSVLYESIVHKALVACGQSPDLFRVITGFAESGQALISAPVDKITFIGSPKVGKMVMVAAAEYLTPVVLELGGKDAAVLCEDCDFGQVRLFLFPLFSSPSSSSDPHLVFLFFLFFCFLFFRA